MISNLNNRLRIVLLIAVVAATTVACAPDDTSKGSGEIRVVASFHPIAEAAERIGGDHVRVTNLTPAGAEPHDLELSPKALDALLDADLVVFIGSGFQPALEEGLTDVEGEIVDVLEGLPVREGVRAEDEVEEHTEEGVDPHVWLDPLLWTRAVQKVGAALARIDPDGADGYRTRETAYVNEIDYLDDEYKEGLGSCKRDLLVTAHTAFGYLAERYGLHEEAIAGISPEAEPDPKRMAELADLVEEQDVTTIFTESLVSPKVAESLARQVGVKTAVLDPLESEPEGGYAEGMRKNLDALMKGLGCR